MPVNGISQLWEILQDKSTNKWHDDGEYREGKPKKKRRTKDISAK